MKKVTYLILLSIVIISNGCKKSENSTENPIAIQKNATLQIVSNVSTSLTNLIKGGVSIKSLIGSGTISEIVPGNYTLTIEASGYIGQSANITLSDGQVVAKNVQLVQLQKYAIIKITTNVSTSLTSLIKGGVLIKSLIGSGTISEIVPGNYSLTIIATGYVSQSENITLSAEQILQKNVQLKRKMVYIPAGTFTMGCTSEQSVCSIDEKPTHLVTLSAFEIGRCEVTQKEWQVVMGTTGHIDENKPAVSHTWKDIIIFCNTLSTREGFTPVYRIDGSIITANWDANGYRLPTEAEWEYAARKESSVSIQNTYSGGNMITFYAWYSGNSGFTTHEVGTKSPNERGIYDMSGNVWEWCWDWHSIDYYTSASQTNPKGPSSGFTRVIRGGAYNTIEGKCRVSNREGINPAWGEYDIGFRVVRTIN